MLIAYSESLCIIYKMHTIKCILFGRNNCMCVRVIERFLFFGFFYFFYFRSHVYTLMYIFMYLCHTRTPVRATACQAKTSLANLLLFFIPSFLSSPYYYIILLYIYTAVLKLCRGYIIQV